MGPAKTMPHRPAMKLPHKSAMKSAIRKLLTQVDREEQSADRTPASYSSSGQGVSGSVRSSLHVSRVRLVHAPDLPAMWLRRSVSAQVNSQPGCHIGFEVGQSAHMCTKL